MNAAYARYRARGGVRENFFTGRLYPLLVAAIVLLGHFCALDLYTNVLLVLLTVIGLMRSDTVRPFFPYLFCVFYQLTREYTTTDTLARYDYLLSGWRVYLVIPSFVLLAVFLFVFLGRTYAQNRRESRDGRYKRHLLPLLFPTLLFTGALFFGGYGSIESYTFWDIVFPLGQFAVYFILFALLYRGIEREDTEELLSYLAYVTMIAAWVLIIEVFALYRPGVAIINGQFNRYRIFLGFGQSTLIAYHLVSLIPIQIYGFVKCRGGLIYLLSALMTYVATLATFSRNGLLFGSVILFFCLICAFFSKGTKKHRRIINRCLLVLIFVGVLALGILFADKVILLVEEYLERGLGDTYRFVQWKRSIETFIAHPIYGAGFYCFDPVEGTSLATQYVPSMSHNTIFELLAKTGLVGLCAYLLYRVATLFVFLRRPNTNKTFLLLACLPLLLMSLLDNYAFQMFTTFHYITALAVACKINREQKLSKL